ncbi:DUF4178 domain-containing protein [Rhodobacterales bacterium HKCCE3408]|nr:DUF4178 domain-containing protein [Rhodobacterales bacterium HKCCE3408]
MTRADGLTSINCTQCGAGLSVLGGGRVTAHVCGYCGAVLEPQENYRILTSIGKRNHPASLVQIGDKLEIEGVTFTVIGTLGLVERYHGQVWTWTDHQLFSPTHGYAWLSAEDGHYLFTRKVRDLPSPSWISTSMVESSENRPGAFFRCERFRYYESGRYEIEFIEGEFNWVPKIDTATDYVTLMSDTAMLTYASDGREREVERSILLDRDDICRQIGTNPSVGRPTKAHPLTPYVAWPNELFMRNALAGFAVAALVLALGFSGLGSRVLSAPGVPVQSLPESFEFDVTSPDQLVEVTLNPDVSNAWAAFEVEVTGPDGEPLATGFRAAERYSGRDSEGSWTEGSGRTSFRFRPAAQGTHTLFLALDDVEPWNNPATPISQVNILVRERRPVTIWLIGAAGLFALLAGLLVARRAAHAKRRWADSDWTDDD